MSYSDQMIDGQDPLVSARAALHFDYPDTASAQVFALIAIAEELRRANDRVDSIGRALQQEDLS